MKFKEYVAVFKGLTIGNGQVKTFYILDEGEITVVLKFKPGHTSFANSIPSMSLPSEIIKLTNKAEYDTGRSK